MEVTKLKVGYHLIGVRGFQITNIFTKLLVEDRFYKLKTTWNTRSIHLMNVLL